MKDRQEAVYRRYRPDQPRKAIEFCLEQLFAEKVKCDGDDVAKDLTYEEVIGALLCGLDAVKEREEREERDAADN